MNAGLKRTGSLKIMFSKPLPPSWKGNERRDLLYRIINLISRKRSWVRTLGQEAAIYCGWWGKAECQHLIAKQEAIIHWQQFPRWLCLFYNKLLKQWESSALGSKMQPLTGARSGPLGPRICIWPAFASWGESENTEEVWAQGGHL